MVSKRIAAGALVMGIMALGACEPTNRQNGTTPGRTEGGTGTGAGTTTPPRTTTPSTSESGAAAGSNAQKDQAINSMTQRLESSRERIEKLRAAEANVHSASALVGVSMAAQLPQINLSSAIGSQALTLGSLFSPAVGPAYSVVSGGILQPLLDGGALQAKKRAAQASLEQAQAQYESTVLLAFRNVADTLRALEYDAQALKATVTAEQASATSLNIARRRLDVGDTTYVVVLIAELTYQQALLARIQAQANRLMDTAALFQALGGGWWNRDQPTNPAQRMVCKAPKPPQPVRTVSQ